MYRHGRLGVSIIVAAVLLATSCGGDDSAVEDDESSAAKDTGSSIASDGTSDQGDDSEGQTVGPEPIDKGLQPFIDDAVNQLVETLGVASADITVQAARLVVWTDSSLGCPDPKMEYAQVPADGSVIELVVDGETYWFHSGGSRTPFPCTSALRQAGSPAQ